MSKRPRAAGWTGRGTGPGIQPKTIEVIELLDDSSQSEDDPNDIGVQARQAPPQAPGGGARPNKRLRRIDASDSTAQQQAQACNAVLGPGHAASIAERAAARRRQPADERQQQSQSHQQLPASQRPGSKARQATLPVASLQRRTALPLQMLNIGRPRPCGAAAPTASDDGAFGGGASPAPSGSAASQRSARVSQDPDYLPGSQSQSQGGASQPTASQQRRPQLRQLTFAPVRTSGTAPTTAAAAGGGGGGGSTRSRGPTAPTARMAAGAGDADVGTGGVGVATRSLGPGPSSSHQPSGLTAEMWYDRHAPRSEEDLVQVLHRKKVAEVKEWLEHQRSLLLSHQNPLSVGSQQQQQHPRPPHPASQQPRLPHQQGVWQPRQSSQAWGAVCGDVGRGAGAGGAGWRPCGLAVLSGPSGCGKSACLRVLAEATGFEVVEWTPPPPVMWHEYQYQRSAGGDAYGIGGAVPYQSKLDDFVSFVSRSKYPSLALTAAAAGAGGGAAPLEAGGAPGSQSGRGAKTSVADHASADTSLPGGLGVHSRPKVLLVEDLPHTHDAERRQRLAAALRDLAACARGPVVLIATEAEGGPGASRGGRGGGGGGPDDGGAMGGAKGLHKDILAVLQSAGATTISFNPVTASNIAKLLLRVAGEERLELAPAAAVGLAEAADGDLRSALQALQMHAMLQKAALRGAEAAGAAGKAGGGKGGRKAGGNKGGVRGGASATALLRAGKQQALTPGEVARLAAAQRDLGLPLFHALGKFLHNKRDGPAAQGDGGEGGSDGEDQDGAGGGKGGRGWTGASQAGGRGGRGAGAGGSEGSKAKRDKDSVALQQLNAHFLAAGRQWKLRHQAELPARLLRPPMRYDPEVILLRCGLEAPVLLSFLHENYLGFVDGEAEDAVDDVAVVSSYLSDSAVLCGQSRAASATAATATGGTSLWLEDSPAAANLSSAIAASVAARGLMYGNTHPAPHRFNPIRAPASTAIDQAAAANRLQLHSAKCRLAAACSGADGASGGVAIGGGIAVPALFSGGSASQLVAAVMPWLRSLAQTSPHHAVWLAPLLPGGWSYYWNGSVTEGAFLHRVAQLPPPGWEGGGGVRGRAVEGMMEQLGLEEDDPIES